ncbi:MAG: RNA polymerase sigma factor [Dehalococcoidia bacterium]
MAPAAGGVGKHVGLTYSSSIRIGVLRRIDGRRHTRPFRSKCASGSSALCVSSIRLAVVAGLPWRGELSLIGVRISLSELLAARSADPAALELLVGEIDSMVAKLIRYHRRRLGGGSCDWDDLRQDVTLRLLKSLPGLRGEDVRSLRAWIRRAVERCLVDSWRARRAQRVDREPGVHLEALIDDEPSRDPLECAADAEHLGLLMRAIASLCPLSREILTLRVVQESSLGEIAGKLGLGTPEAARSRFRRVLGDLRAILTRLHPEEL